MYKYSKSLLQNTQIQIQITNSNYKFKLQIQITNITNSHKYSFLFKWYNNNTLYKVQTNLVFHRSNQEYCRLKLFIFQ